jgi:hypothetical protein
VPREEDFERYAAFTRMLAEWDALDDARTAAYVASALELDEALGESVP